MGQLKFLVNGYLEKLSPKELFSESTSMYFGRIRKSYFLQSH